MLNLNYTLRQAFRLVSQSSTFYRMTIPDIEPAATMAVGLCPSCLYLDDTGIQGPECTLNNACLRSMGHPHLYSTLSCSSRKSSSKKNGLYQYKGQANGHCLIFCKKKKKKLKKDKTGKLCVIIL